MRREKLDYIVTIEMIEEKRMRSKGKQRGKFLDRLTKWLKVGRVTDVLKEMRDRGAWKVMKGRASDWLMA